MTFKAANIAIESRFTSGFTACPVKYANVDYRPVAGVAWAELHVVVADSINAEIGSGLHREVGIISVNIYDKRGFGTANAREKADLAAAVFRDAQFDGITCRSPKVVAVGEVEEWYVVNMSVPYYRDEFF